MIALAPLNRRFAADVRPRREAKTFSAFCDTVRLPDGPSAGHLWITATEPVQDQYVHEVDAGLWSWFIIAAPSQSGKTLRAIMSPTLYHLTEHRQPVVYVLPSLDLLSKSWEGKLSPSIIGMGYGPWMPTKGPGSKGGRPAVLTFRDPATSLVAGRMYFTAMGTGKRETATASVTAQTIVVDEADDAVDAGKLKNVCKRINSYGIDGRAYVASTVNDSTGREAQDPSDPSTAHPILTFIKEGSQHRAHHRCPHCKGYFIPELEHLDIEACAITCPLCAVVWSEDDRKDALNNLIMCGMNDRIVDGKRILGQYDNRIYSELTTCLDYHMVVLSSVCEDMRSAKRKESFDSSLMRTAMNKLWCRPYVPPMGALAITNKGLASISALSDYDKRIVPHWVTHLTGAVDVQDNRHYWGVAGIGPDDRWCAIDWGYEMLVPMERGEVTRAPTAGDRRRINVLIDAKFNEGWTKEGGKEILRPLPGLRGIDVGDGDVTSEIVNWLRGMPNWRAVRGAHKEGFSRLGKLIPDLPPEAKAFLELRQPEGWPIYLYNVLADTVRRWLHASLLRPAYTPDSGMLPRGLDAKDMLLLHLSGKVWVEPTMKGAEHVEGFWNDKAHSRHDLLDVFTYALALSRFRAGLQTVNAQRKPVKYGRIGSVGIRR